MYRVGRRPDGGGERGGSGEVGGGGGKHRGGHPGGGGGKGEKGGGGAEKTRKPAVEPHAFFVPGAFIFVLFPSVTDSTKRGSPPRPRKGKLKLNRVF